MIQQLQKIYISNDETYHLVIDFVVGTPVNDHVIQLSPKAPAMNTRNFPWARLGNLSMQKSGRLADLQLILRVRTCCI